MPSLTEAAMCVHDSESTDRTAEQEWQVLMNSRPGPTREQLLTILTHKSYGIFAANELLANHTESSQQGNETLLQIAQHMPNRREAVWEKLKRRKGSLSLWPSLLDCYPEHAHQILDKHLALLSQEYPSYGALKFLINPRCRRAAWLNFREHICHTAIMFTLPRMQSEYDEAVAEIQGLVRDDFPAFIERVEALREHRDLMFEILERLIELINEEYTRFDDLRYCETWLDYLGDLLTKCPLIRERMLEHAIENKQHHTLWWFAFNKSASSAQRDLALQHIEVETETALKKMGYSVKNM